MGSPARAQVRYGRLVSTAVGLVCAARASADDEHGPPIDPSAFAPAGRLLLAVAAVAAVVGVWYYVRTA
jgi:hypothetical protein